jgi:hypothetical protein
VGVLEIPPGPGFFLAEPIVDWRRLLASWATASNVVATPHLADEKAGPEVRPSAASEVRPAA